MKNWQRAAVLLGALGVAGVLVPRYFWFKRREFPGDFEPKALILRDRTDLALAHLKRGHERLVIIAHGLLKTMNDPGLVRLAEALGERFDVLTFDFPDHGHSGGECDLSFANAANILLRVIEHACALGYAHIGVAGYSMGAAAAIMASAQGAPVEAIVSVSSPAAPRASTTASAQRPTHAWRWRARCMGTRIAAMAYSESWPIEYVAQVSPIPLLIVHNGFDTLIRREDSEALFAVAKPPKDYLYMPRALHAWPMASVEQVITWLDERIPAGDRLPQSK